MDIEQALKLTTKWAVQDPFRWWAANWTLGPPSFLWRGRREQGWFVGGVFPFQTVILGNTKDLQRWQGENGGNWWQCIFKLSPTYRMYEILWFVGETELPVWEVQVLWQWSGIGLKVVNIILSVRCIDLQFQKCSFSCSGKCKIMAKRHIYIYITPSPTLALQIFNDFKLKIHYN